MHVEQEIAGDDKSVLETVMEVDKERLWLQDLEKKLLAKTDEDGVTEEGVEPKINGVGLMEVRGLART